jgi:tRNA-2-methylthio-N6-dimethylallyladenosine synthase
LREIAGKKKEREIILAVMGCMAQREGERLFELVPGLDIIFGVDSFRNVAAKLDEVMQNRSRQMDISGRKSGHSPLSRGHTFSIKGYIAVMRGCNNWCSYCVVPGARGTEKSRPLKEIKDEVKRLVDKGVKEVTFLGQNISAYGKDTGNRYALIELLREINKIAGLLRIRFITSHPRDVWPGLFKAMRELEKVTEYLHLPIQTGSDRILKLMNRGYTVKYYMNLVEKIRKEMPAVSLGTDFIVGFPGERDKDFRDTLKAAETIGFDMAYMYKYSPRPGTKAFGMEGQVSEAAIKERHRSLLKLQEKISLKKNKALIGKEAEVLVEGRSKRNKERLAGRDRGNRMVVFEGRDELIGEVVRLIIKDATNLTLYGER